tara:strand:- start:73 stop:1470 length:1398 start_codon:yes stop_codon:yes gene_type:complete
MKLHFLGAAESVTGSCYVLETANSRVMIDCGMYQERDLQGRNWEPIPIAASSIDVLLLTHAHLDHSGLLPKLMKEGFKGEIYCTAATAEIAEIILMDSAKIQKEDVRKKIKRHRRQKRKSPRPPAPLYEMEDVTACKKAFRTVKYDEPVTVAEGVEARFHDAGHILGSSMLELSCKDTDGPRRVVFSGDIGHLDVPLLKNPTLLTAADVVVMESTYGDRTHESNDDVDERFAAFVNETVAAGGNLIIPSFAVERTQELLYHIGKLRMDRRIPSIMVFVDSPMAIRVTEVFRHHPELFDKETQEMLEQGTHPCDFPGLTMSRTVAQSKAINLIRGSAIVIAGSGMCTGGCVKHHLKNNLDREESTLLFVGYQAHGTLGRHILEKPEEVRIFGEQYPVRLRIEKLNGMSGHADRDGLMRWLSAFEAAPQHLFLTHGEKSVSHKLSKHIDSELGLHAAVPAYLSEADI